MSTRWISVCLLVGLLLISTTSALDEERSIILENDQSSAIIGDVYVFVAFAAVVFAALIIVKLLMTLLEGGSE